MSYVIDLTPQWILFSVGRGGGGRGGGGGKSRAENFPALHTCQNKHLLLERQKKEKQKKIMKQKGNYFSQKKITQKQFVF